MPGLDGLRGLAVAAVVAFHLRPGGVPGGFLGVDLFFVLSGFLITSLLLLELDARRERSGRGAVDLGRFWARRARRLLPALLLTLAVVTLAARRWLPDWQLGRIRADGLAALGYVANWHDALRDVAYFDTAASASPFAHLWSLAIEEQIYLLWPLALLGLYRLTGGCRKRLAVAVAVLAGASAIAMALTPDHEFAYLATHTRAQTLLLGALLAVLTTRDTSAADGPATDPTPTGTRRAWGGAGVVALAGLAAMVALVDGRDPWMYRGGFTLAALLGVVAVAAASRGAGPVGALTRLAPLRLLGRTSYGCYLYHWPLIVFLNEGRTGLDGWRLDAVRLAATAVVTAASYVVIEQPIRQGRLRGWPEWAGAPLAAGATAAVLVVVGMSAGPPPSYLAGGSGGPRFPDSSSGVDGPAFPDETSSTTTVPVASTTTEVQGRPPPGRIVIVGDSVAFSLWPGLAAAAGPRGIEVVNRSVVGCGVVTNSLPADDRGKPLAFTQDCPSGVGDVESQVPALAPDLVVVLSTWEAGHRDAGGVHLEPTTPPWKESLRAGLHEMLTRVAPGGTPVMFLLEAPRVHGLERTTDLDDPGTAAWARLQREVARETGQMVVDLGPAVCGGHPSDCPTEIDGIRVRPDDGAHFGPEGAVVVGGPVLDAILARWARAGVS
jgi:peptidoglycan/LPS O-acetylase OafA/YrhL